MYMRELETFVATADAGSFLQAAQRLFLTPAAVMNQVNKLEKMTGVKLLIRTNQGVALTAAGQSCYQDAKKIIALANEAMDNARRIAANEEKVIRIGSSLLRPATQLINLCEKAAEGPCPFQFRIVPFQDDPEGLESALASLGHLLDCIAGPCDSIAWKMRYSILPIGCIPCRIALPRTHPLANRTYLTWEDLSGQEFMLIQRGDSPVLNQMRDDILAHHPQIRIRDAEHKYDAEAFNECLQLNCLMETLDIWTEAHPSLVTLPMEWEYEVPFGIIYAKDPAPIVQKFIYFVRQNVDGAGATDYS